MALATYQPNLGPPFRQALRVGGAIALSFTVTWALAGCAVGRNDTDGSLVLGFKAGQLVENTNQAIAAAANVAGGFLPPPFGQLLTLGGIGLAAHMSGRNKGWDEKDNELRTKGTA